MRCSTFMRRVFRVRLYPGKERILPLLSGRQFTPFGKLGFRRPCHGAFGNVAGLFILACMLIATCGGVLAKAQEGSESTADLRDQIDDAILSRWFDELPPVADDAEFARRIYLDLLGVIPSRDELLTFLQDENIDKREVLVDRLLADDRFAYRMADFLDVTLGERRPDKQIAAADWRNYLLQAFRDNRPLNVVLSEVLGNDGADPETRPAVKFYLDREGEPNLITRDVGRIFFGVDLQCAQCHDHPNISSYYQADYYELFAFFQRGFVFTAPDKQVFYAEKGEGEATYTSVFTGEMGTAIPSLPRGISIEDPVFENGELYTVAPEKDVRPIPKYSRRGALANIIKQGDNRAFNENMANRLWAMVMGRGLVDPVDLLHDDNPPYDRELLTLLAGELSAMDFNVRRFLKELVLSRVYQRSYDGQPILERIASGIPTLDESFAQRMDELMVQTEAVEAELREVRSQFTAASDAFDKAKADWVESQSILNTEQAQLAETQQQLQTIEEQLLQVQAKQTAVLNAKTAAETARVQLPDQSELTAAIAVFDTRLANLGPTLEELDSQRETLASRIPQMQQSVTELAEIMSRREQAYRQAETHHEESGLRFERLKRELETARSRRHRYERLTQALDQVSRYQVAVGDSQAALDELQMQQHPMEELVLKQTRMEAEISEQTSRLVDLAQQVAMVEAGLAAKDAQMQGLAAQLAAVDEAINSTQAAIELLPDDSALQSALDQLQESRAVHAQEMADLEGVESQLASQLGDRQETQQAAEARLNVLETENQALARELESRRATLAPFVEAAERSEQQRLLAESAAIESLEANFLVGTLRPMTPEQLAWSTLTATGVVRNTYAAARQEIITAAAEEAEEAAGQQPTQESADETTQVQVGEPSPQQVDALAREKLKGATNLYVSLFANAGGQPQDDFFATVEQTLFLKNGGQLRGWIAAGGDSLRMQAQNAESIDDTIDELYLAILSRYPDPSERAHGQAFFNADERDKNQSIQAFAWALLSSNEFRFQH